jgi:hypothetical protein
MPPAYVKPYVLFALPNRQRICSGRQRDRFLVAFTSGHSVGRQPSRGSIGAVFGSRIKCYDGSRLTVHILAAVAEHEREMISQRTKSALEEQHRAQRTLPR